ncbi:hypothetical protein [Rhodococcus opacus]|uniref:Uncharacterized protein n=1 Tax=Rhodococcus opacus TaxID=37919 RepID=A0A2S8IPA9_RHOOP|nr:hypothetical protein [Rhodococcus opacus]PQP16525.1 hypothetical protein C5613_36175 [Rhodococcus opacus]
MAQAPDQALIGNILPDLAVTFTLGGACLVGRPIPGAHPEEFGHVAFDPALPPRSAHSPADVQKRIATIDTARGAAGKAHRWGPANMLPTRAYACVESVARWSRHCFGMLYSVHVPG